jgi:hypothetical protein
MRFAKSGAGTQTPPSFEAQLAGSPFAGGAVAAALGVTLGALWGSTLAAVAVAASAGALGAPPQATKSAKATSETTDVERTSSKLPASRPAPNGQPRLVCGSFGCATSRHLQRWSFGMCPSTCSMWAPQPA